MINLLKALFSPMLEEIKQSICESICRFSIFRCKYCYCHSNRPP